MWHRSLEYTLHPLSSLNYWHTFLWLPEPPCYSKVEVLLRVSNFLCSSILSFDFWNVILNTMNLLSEYVSNKQARSAVLFEKICSWLVIEYFCCYPKRKQTRLRVPHFYSCTTSAYVLALIVKYPFIPCSTLCSTTFPFYWNVSSNETDWLPVSGNKF